MAPHPERKSMYAVCSLPLLKVCFQTSKFKVVFVRSSFVEQNKAHLSHLSKLFQFPALSQFLFFSPSLSLSLSVSLSISLVVVFLCLMKWLGGNWKAAPRIAALSLSLSLSLSSRQATRKTASERPSRGSLAHVPTSDGRLKEISAEIWPHLTDRTRAPRAVPRRPTFFYTFRYSFDIE